nr:hypothetical protein [Actinopolymorpha alba]
MEGEDHPGRKVDHTSHYNGLGLTKVQANGRSFSEVLAEQPTVVERHWLHDGEGWFGRLARFFLPRGWMAAGH